MNERDEFLRDRLQPDRPGTPAGPPPNRQRSAPPPAVPPPPRPPGPPPSFPPRPPQPPQPRPPAGPPPPRQPPVEQPRQQVASPPPARPAGPPVRPASTPPPVIPAPDGALVPTGRPELPDTGWRRILRLLTFGLVKLGPSPAQQQDAQFETTIRTGFRGKHKVGVVGKGGVGKTSVAASVGSLFAELRRGQDHVVAIDADTAFGRLSSRIDPRSTSSFWELTADKNLETFTDVAQRVGRNAVGLHVLAGEPASGPRRVLDPAIYREAASRLDRYFTISVIDCGSTMDSPVTQEVLRDLDALIVVSSPWADGASAAARTMEWLSDQGMTELLHNTIVVLNDSDGHADKRTRALLAREFVDHGQPVVEVPYDPHLRPGGVIDVTHEMGRPTRRKLLQATALIAEFFGRSPERAS
ncbi:MAG: MinD/ParA family protein [Actinomycetota bacterium]|uniref:MinD/ParA family protein n=1 Tax=Mycobacterium lentiflavum TaxID=141349 RepID=A0ABY3UUE7_MYCLN|nr:MinD/ParA family protein [Mycobacterium lentiflavum]MEE3063623.1 MinD/ParA family protein [Actinomycetota bacterium]ULP42397.1 MinD/ParA family protein [Mycobacterium lentiflavum]